MRLPALKFKTNIVSRLVQSTDREQEEEKDEDIILLRMRQRGKP